MSFFCCNLIGHNLKQRSDKEGFGDYLDLKSEKQKLKPALFVCADQPAHFCLLYL